MGAEVHTGAMIALLPTEDEAQKLVLEVEGAEEPEQLHITNAFLGKAADIPEDQQRKLIAAMGTIAGKWPPTTVRVFSVNLFNPGGEEPCVVLGCGGKELSDLHDAIHTAMRDAGTELPPDAHHPWIPHITLIYYPEDVGYESIVKEIVDSDRLGEITVDRIRLAFAGQDTDIPLTGTQESKAMLMTEQKAIRRGRTPAGAQR